MDRMLGPRTKYDAAFWDDVIVYSSSWEEHVGQVAAALKSLRQAELTANPKKCAVGCTEVRHLGYHMGGRQVHPEADKTAAIAACQSPKRTKKEVKHFLGLASHNRWFIPTWSGGVG